MKKINADYIIAGGGMAGLSLAYYLIVSKLSSKKIVIIDKEPKTKNDRTWCFWEKGVGTFDAILYKKWDKLYFGNQFGQLRLLEMGGYSYKMLRGIDFYTFVQAKLNEHPNVHFIYDTIRQIDSTSTQAIVLTNEYEIVGEFVFDSVYQLQVMRQLEHKVSSTAQHNLLQHFKGIVIETPTAYFDVEKPQWMNFGIEQHNECRFIYILPFSPHQALIEFTIFSDNLLSSETYQTELEKYIRNELKITDYKVIEEEFGVIPMSDEKLPILPQSRIVRIGTAGGSTHAATGYTFRPTQKRLKLIVEQLEKTGFLYHKISFSEKRHHLYASVLLNVLSKKRYPAAPFFDELYRKNPPVRVFKFLDGETTFLEELKVMSSTPIGIFLRATTDVLGFKLTK